MYRREARSPIWRSLAVSVVAGLALVVSSIPTAPTARAAGNDVTFYGGGWGHGVGMSQYGAQGQALVDGKKYKAILRHYYTGAEVADLADTSPGSPIVNYDDSLWLGALQSKGSVEFIARNGDLEICHSGGNCPMSRLAKEGEVWTFRVKKPGVCIFELDGEKKGKSGDCWANIKRLGGARVELPALGKTFGHGKMRIRPVGDVEAAKKVHVSFSMDLEEYVLGIAEMFNSWEPHALRAQAVAARSYAVARAHQRETKPRGGSGVNPGFSSNWKNICWCHVRASTADQSYAGWQQTQNSNWSSAVNATAGEIMTHPDDAFTEDGVVTTFYSSSSGGVTETNIGGFGSTVQYPYLESVDDHWSELPAVGNPYAQWEKSVSVGNVIAALAGTSNSWHVEFDTLIKAKLIEGAPEAKVRFVGVVDGEQVSVEAPGWWLRSAFGLRGPSISDVDHDLGGTHGETWSQDTGSIAGLSEPGDRFGSPLATGDFNGDGHPDVAAGAPRDGVNEIPTAGLINVIYGSPGGLVETGNAYFYQDQGAVANTSEKGDAFGSALAVGDFNGDGFDDLAVGVPKENVAGVKNAGLVHVFFGSQDGLEPSGNALAPGHGGMPGSPKKGDRFGASLAAGDFDDDGRDDLVVGKPGKGVGGAAKAGSALVIPGSSSGPDTSASQGLHQNKDGVAGTAEGGDKFGSALAAGDVDGDGFEDLAVGSPGEDFGEATNAGGVHLFFGGNDGLRPARSRWAHQGSKGIAGKSQDGDRFGEVIAIGDLTDNGKAEIVIGVPGEKLNGKPKAGRVVVVKGKAGRALDDAVVVIQGSDGVPGSPNKKDRLGSALSVARVGYGSFNALVVGVPGEDLAGAGGAGLVLVVPGGQNMVKPAKAYTIKQDDLPDDQLIEAGDRFGSAVAANDLDGDTLQDLILGSPGEDWGSIVDAGSFSTIDNLK